MKRIAVIGDYNSQEETHNLILKSLEDVSEDLQVELDVQWIASDELDISEDLSAFDGFWFSPGSPYRNTKNVLSAIRYARENGVPALGTCAGFQHMVIEFARNVLGLNGADSVENDADCENPVIERLACSLVRKKEQLTISDPDSILGKTMGESEFVGEYRCNYGFNETYSSAFRASDEIKAVVQNNEECLRGFEIKEHPFFVGTLFIPQLDYRGNGPYRIIKSFIKTLKTGDISYRMVRKEDGYSWYTLINDVWREAYAHIFPQEVFEERETWKDDKIREFTEEKFLGDRKIAYVAECDGKIIGVMFGTLDSVYEHFRGEYADLVALYIYPEYHGMGVGTALKDIFMKWAKEKGAERFVIGVLKENSKARKVYESWGGQLSEYTYDFELNDVKYPECFYTLEL